MTQAPPTPPAHVDRATLEGVRRAALHLARAIDKALETLPAPPPVDRRIDTRSNKR